MKTKETKTATVIARCPLPLVRKLDAAARRSGRSRSSELCLRLQESLKHFPAVPAPEAGAV